jgi:DNA-directed RNA polymerase specialized sigma24 family protein
MTLAELLTRWREQAAVLRSRGAPAQADALATCAAEVEEAVRMQELEGLTVAEAAAESGYSPSQLRRAFPGQRRIRRGDLPRKPRHPSGPDLAGDILRAG